MTYDRFGDEELIPIVKYGHEKPDLDYKGPINWNKWANRGKVDLVRDMMALANTDIPEIYRYWRN